MERNAPRAAPSGSLPRREPNEWRGRLWIVAGAVGLVVLVMGARLSFDVMTGYPKLLSEMFNEQPGTARLNPAEANGATNHPVGAKAGDR